jgi:hypothetical protein
MTIKVITVSKKSGRGIDNQVPTCPWFVDPPNVAAKAK